MDFLIQSIKLKHLITSDHIRGLLCHHDGGGVQVAADNAGHDAGVNYPQFLQAQHLNTAIFDKNEK